MNSGSGTSRRGFLAASAAAPLALSATSPAFARQENGQIAADLERYVGFGIKASGGAGDEACGAWLEAELAAAGFATDRGIKGLVPTALVAILASVLLYVPGVAWAMLADTVFGLDATKWGADSFASIWQYYMAPFLLGDAIKAVMAALIVTGGWAALRGRNA